MSDDGFLSWVKKKHKLQERSARDVLSRVKRASTFINVDAPGSNEKVIFEMGLKSDFKKLSPTVKSHLKRAVTLYREFKEQKKR